MSSKKNNSETNSNAETQTNAQMHSSAEANSKETQKETPAQPKQEPQEDERRQALLEQLQRLQAEFHNYRKRTESEISEAQEAGKEKAIKELLPVIDSLNLAKTHSNAQSSAEELASGLALIQSQLQSILESWGVETVRKEGLVDPRLHEVYLTETIEGTPAGTIIQVLQEGYARKGKVLRTAKIKAAGK